MDPKYFITHFGITLGGSYETRACAVAHVKQYAADGIADSEALEVTDDPGISLSEILALNPRCWG